MNISEIENAITNNWLELNRPNMDLNIGKLFDLN